MTSFFHPRTWTCVIVLLAGCTADPVDRLFDGSSNVALAICDCFPDPEECRVRVSEDLARSDRACFRQVSAEHPSAATWIDCAANATDNYQACLGGNHCVGDVYSACTVEVNERLGACPTPDADALAALSACTER